MVRYPIADKALSDVNGDIAVVESHRNHLLVILVDGAGHGMRAHQIACKMVRYLQTHQASDLPKLMSDLHSQFLGTRGGVAIIGKLSLLERHFKYVAIGNIFIRHVGDSAKYLPTQDGVLGYSIRTPKLNTVALEEGDSLVLHTDGISMRLTEVDCRNMGRIESNKMALQIINRFAKNDDDACCVVMTFS